MKMKTFNAKLAARNNLIFPFSQRMKIESTSIGLIYLLLRRPSVCFFSNVCSGNITVKCILTFSSDEIFRRSSHI